MAPTRVVTCYSLVRTTLKLFPGLFSTLGGFWGTHAIMIGTHQMALPSRHCPRCLSFGCCRAALIARWLANDATDACRIFRLGAAGRPSSQDGWPMMLVCLSYLSVGCCRALLIARWLANDAADACRIFRLVAAGRPSSRGGWAMMLLMLAIAVVWVPSS